MLSGENPCNVCKEKGRCDLLNNNCILARFGQPIGCYNNECMLNVEDCCLIGIEDSCGSNPEVDLEWED